ncbi:MAG TPA: EAL domain-containing protein [Candidatus Baltobacteraceae bacterium]|jgi:EAL domain-containing protein (putative c-di-GMP-specific phosphodiesterase class I)|nr:EAL domain-containing protein [Candidatus Baltobacteraceae bacterium]
MAGEVYITALYDDFVAAARTLFSLGVAGMQPDDICVAMNRREELMDLCERIATVPIESNIARQLQEAGIRAERAEHCERQVEAGAVLLLLRSNGSAEAINAALAQSGGDFEAQAMAEPQNRAEEPEDTQPQIATAVPESTPVPLPVPATGAFVLCMQPIFELRSGVATRAEALLRYDAPDRALIAWPQFDRAGIVQTMATRWALAQLLQRAPHWHREHGIDRVHLNVTLSEETSLNSIVEALASSAVSDRKSIAIELSVMSRVDHCVLENALRALHGLDVETGIDLDEVTSANIPALHGLPFSFLKIRSQDARYVAIETLPWDVFLTRVQSPLPWDDLRDRGVKFVQGFVLEPPLPIADFEVQVKSGRFSRRNPTVGASP